MTVLARAGFFVPDETSACTAASESDCGPQQRLCRCRINQSCNGSIRRFPNPQHDRTIHRTTRSAQNCAALEMNSILWFAIIRSGRNRLTLEWMEGKNRTHASLVPIHVSVHATTAERSSGRRHRECRASPANRRISETAEATGSQDPRSSVLDCSSQPVV